MNILPQNRIIARYPIRESENAPTAFIDTNKNGELDFEDGFSDEPALPVWIEDIKEHAQDNGLQFVTKSNYEELSTSRLEKESGSEDDWQFNEDDTLTEVASSLSSGPAEWVINPMIDGAENEMEFIILKSSDSAPSSKPDGSPAAQASELPKASKPEQLSEKIDLNTEQMTLIQDLWNSL